jgi:ABC-type sugar transport system substrate-binding protein
MRIIASIGFIAAIFTVQPAAAATFTGADLLGRCEAAEKSMGGGTVTAKESLDSMWCMGYISGLLDGFGIGDYRIGQEKAACPPEDGVTREQALKAVNKWLREHPDAMQKSGRRGAILALTSAYPCK